MSDNRILMDVIPMMSEVLGIANRMIRKAALPDFRLTSDQGADRMRISFLDQLDSALDGPIIRWRKQKMNVVRHEDEGVQTILAFATVAKESLEEQSCVVLDLKQPAAIPCRKG